MKQEIERKFLVVLEKLPVLGEGQAITQGYLSTSPVVRVRMAEDASRTQAWITIKGSGTITRAEFEYEIPPEDSRLLLDLCKVRISKVRYRIPWGAHTWELDRFTGTHEGLYIAEIELRSEEEDFERPLWLGKEVSQDPRYSNSALAALKHRH